MARKKKMNPAASRPAPAPAPASPPAPAPRPARRSLARALGSAALVALLVLALCEALLHLAPGLAPMAVAEYLPASGRQAVAKAHGYMTRDMVMGGKLLYSYNPATARGERAFPIDGNGFRNPGLPGEAVDVVLLGDSLLIAEGAGKDLGDRIREQGLSAYNLGMGGYGPPQYLDAYKRYVIDPKVRHRVVVVLVCLANDFKDSEKFAATAKAGGDYTWYLNEGQRPAPESDSWIWTPGLLAGLGDLARGWGRAAGTVQVATPYATFAMDRDALNPKNVFAGTKEQAYLFSMSTVGILHQAAAAGARVLFVFMPNSANIYADFALDPAARATVQEHYDTVTSEFPTWCRASVNTLRLRGFDWPQYEPGRDYWLLDALPALRRAAASELVTVTPGDYHLNTRGIEVLFSAIAPLVQDLLAGRTPSP